MQSIEVNDDQNYDCWPKRQTKNITINVRVSAPVEQKPPDVGIRKTDEV